MSRRTEQVSTLLRQEINNIMMKHFEAPKGTLVSVTQVEVSRDLKNAVAYLSIIPSSKAGSALQKVQKATNYIQHQLGKELTMKFTPKIAWKIDERDLKYKIIDEALALKK